MDSTLYTAMETAIYKKEADIKFASISQIDSLRKTILSHIKIETAT